MLMSYYRSCSNYVLCIWPLNQQSRARTMWWIVEPYTAIQTHSFFGDEAFCKVSEIPVGGYWDI